LDNRKVLEAKIRGDILLILLAPKTTDSAQHVDNNIGKTVKSDTRELFNDFLQEFDWESNPTGKISAKSARMTMARILLRRG